MKEEKEIGLDEMINTVQPKAIEPSK